MTSSNVAPTKKKKPTPKDKLTPKEKKVDIPNPLSYMEQAREIMGPNYFGITEAKKHFMEWAIKPFTASPEELWNTHLNGMRTPFGRVIPLAEMEKCKNTHVLVAYVPMPILTILDSVEGILPYTFEGVRYDTEEAFTTYSGSVGWYLVRKASVRGALGKMWGDQQLLLSARERTQKARVMVYTIVGNFLTTGKLLFKSRQVRCLDVLQNGQRISVGCSATRLVFSCWDDNRADGNLGLSAANK